MQQLERYYRLQPLIQGAWTGHWLSGRAPTDIRGTQSLDQKEYAGLVGRLVGVAVESERPEDVIFTLKALGLDLCQLESWEAIAERLASIAQQSPTSDPLLDHVRAWVEMNLQVRVKYPNLAQMALGGVEDVKAALLGEAWAQLAFTLGMRKLGMTPEKAQALMEQLFTRPALTALFVRLGFAQFLDIESEIEFAMVLTCVEVYQDAEMQCNGVKYWEFISLENLEAVEIISTSMMMMMGSALAGVDFATLQVFFERVLEPFVRERIEDYGAEQAVDAPSVDYLECTSEDEDDDEEVEAML